MPDCRTGHSPPSHNAILIKLPIAQAMLIAAINKFNLLAQILGIIVKTRYKRVNTACKFPGGLQRVPVVSKPVMVISFDSIVIQGKKQAANNKPAEKKASHFEYRIQEIDAQK